MVIGLITGICATAVVAVALECEVAALVLTGTAILVARWLN